MLIIIHQLLVGGRLDKVIMVIEMEKMVLLATSGVYCLVNEAKGIIEVVGSVNMLDSLNRILKSLETGEFGSLSLDEMSGVKLTVLETCPVAEIKIKEHTWRELYKLKGYSFYKDYKVTRYKVRQKLVTLGAGGAYFVVVLENTTKKDRILVGVFDKKEECDTFLSQYYMDGVVLNIVVHENNLYKSWIEKGYQV